MKRRLIRNGWLTKAALICLAATVGWTAHAAPRPPASNKPAPGTVRTVADFTWIGAGGKTYPGKNFRGQPVVILIAASPTDGDVLKQAGRIADRYLDFASRKTIFVAAFTASGPSRVESNVPFTPAQNGAAVAAAYGVQGKGLAVVVLGPDGNVDLVSPQVEGAQRLLDVINNSLQPQAAERTQNRS